MNGRVKNSLISIPLESWIGFFSSFSEAYSMSLLAYMTPILGPLLFKNTSAQTSTIFSFLLIFLGSLIMYPLGAWYYGRIGDLKGRRAACTSSSFGLAVVTGAIALLPINVFPNYTWCIFFVPFSLQFFFASGEYYSSVVFSLEHGSTENQGFLSGLSCFFSVVGIAFASGIGIFCIHFSHIISWRFAYIVGFLTGLISFGFKFCCKESPKFNLNQEESKSLSWDFMKKNLIAIVSVTLIAGFFYSIYAYIFLFLPLVYNESVVANSQLETFICLTLYGFGLLITGYLADKYEIKATMCVGIMMFLGFLLIFIPIFHSIPLTIRLLLTLCACIYIGPIHSWVIEQSESHTRCRITAIGTALATACFSGSCVPVCLFLHQKFASLWISSMYIVFLAVITLLVLLKPLKLFNRLRYYFN